MDHGAFDDLVRSLAGSRTRRRLLATLAAAPLGTLAALGGDDEAAAKHPVDRVRRRRAQKRRKRRNRNKRNKGNSGNNNHPNSGGATPSPLAFRTVPTQQTAGVSTATCVADGGACCANSDCCAGNCFNRVCAEPVTQCQGADCGGSYPGCNGDECCGDPAFFTCNGQCCGPPAFWCDPVNGCSQETHNDGQFCCDDAECTSGNCFNRICAAPVTQCQGAGCGGSANGCAEGNCCAAPATFSCGVTCCESPDTFCCGNQCCGTGQMCCGDACCQLPAVCCGNNNSCCDANNACCGDVCCQPGQVCCGETCCDAGTPVCAAGGVCCNPGDVGACGDQCCGQGTNMCCDNTNGPTCCTG